MGSDPAADRARHGGGDGYLRSGGGARQRTPHRGGPAGRGAGRPGGDRGLPWRRPMTDPLAGTLPGLLRRNARDFGDRPAIREKDLGVWQTWCWRDYFAHVRDFAAGLAAEGFARGDRLAVIGDNRPRLYAAQLAAHALGGIAVPVYQDSIARELAYVLEHAGVSIVVAEDQEQADKILS